MKNDTNSKSIANGIKARGDFNDFLNRTVRLGDLSVEHMRVRSRQAATESFARKAVFAVKTLSPSTGMKFSVTEQKPPCTLDSAGLGEATALYIGTSHPALAKYLGDPSTADATAESDNEIDNIDLFTMLNAYAGFEVSKRLSATPAMASGPVSVANGIGNYVTDMSFDIKNAADSVYTQSFADVHAISLHAAFDGNTVALTTLNEVMAIRESGGDFGKYSLAPLSHDTRSAMEILRSQLSNGKNFSEMTRDELWDNSRWAAAEGVATWMQGHGVNFQDTSNLTVGLDAVNQIAAKASNTHNMSNSSRPAMRPMA